MGRCRLRGPPRVQMHAAPHACFQLLQLKYDELLSSVALKCNLRHYVMAVISSVQQGLSAVRDYKVGRCSLTPG